MATTNLFLPKLCLGRGTARRVVEGQPRQNAIYDLHNHGIKIVEYSRRSDPQSFDTMAGQHSVALGIPFRLIASTMRLAINFYAEARGWAVEIQRIGTGRMLASKFETGRSLTQRRPQQHFRKRHLPAQNARASYCLGWFPEHGAGPSTMLRMVPLPKTSLGRN